MSKRPRSSKYADEVWETVWAMVCDGYGTPTIARKLKDGEGPLDYRIEIPPATVKNMRKSLIAEKGDPRPILKPEEEMDAVSAARRQLSTVLVRESQRLTGIAARTGMLEGKQLDQAIKTERALHEIENRKEKKPTRDSEKIKRGHETRRQNAPKTLAEMAARNRPQNDESPADGEAPDLRSSPQL